jgi:pimeloyl-ACP methyl ester carboxylesterase
MNKNILASGLVCLPKTSGNYPVFSFQNGTNTLHSEAPTEAFGNSDAYYNDLFQVLASVASMGFIVVVPDYIGFGASSNEIHPYLHAGSSTQCVLDMLRATKELCSEDQIVAKPTKDLFLFGYSQGGWATMQLQKTIEKDYSSEFNLKASSCGAGAYSIEYMNEYITSQTSYPMPYFLTYLLNSYHSLELMSNPLSDFIQAPYAAMIPGLYDGEHSGVEINFALTTQMADLLTPEYLSGYATSSKFSEIKSAFQANSIVAWPTTTPTKLYHGADDIFIPPGLSQKMLADFKTAGVPDSQIQLVVIPSTDHQTAIFPVGLQTILWFLTLK